MGTILQNLETAGVFLENHPLIFIAIIVWSLIWKGFGLWKSAQLAHKGWFVAILLLNTLGIIEIVYLFIIAKKYSVKVEESSS